MDYRAKIWSCNFCFQRNPVSTYAMEPAVGDHPSGQCLVGGNGVVVVPHERIRYISMAKMMAAILFGYLLLLLVPCLHWFPYFGLK